MTMQGGVRVRITGDDSDLQNTLRGSATRLAKWGAAAAAAGAAATAALVRSGLESADAQAKLARQLNTTTESYQRITRAAEMAGVSSSQLESATRNLNSRLGDAIGGSGAAADALDRLGLSAKDVADLPLDERVETINRALMDNVSAAERASVASDLYGRRAGLAMSQIDGGTIEEATRQIDRFGGALSEIDAAQVEAANDAISQGGVAFQAVTQQLAVQFAPVLQGIVQELENAADETDFFGSIAERTFDVVMKGAAFAADAIRGIRVVVKGLEAAFWGLQSVGANVWRLMLEGWDAVANGIAEGINEIIRGLNRIPFGPDIAELETGMSTATRMMTQYADFATEKMTEAGTELHDLLMQPLPSEGLNEWVENVKDAAERAAEETVEAREAMGIPALPDGEDQDAPQAGGMTDEERERIEDRLAELDTYYESELDGIRRREDEKKEIIDEAHDAGLLSEEEYQHRLSQIEAEGAEARKRTQREESQAKFRMASDMMGNLSTLMNTENRKLFEIGKAAAISQAALDGYQAVLSSYRVGASIGGPVVGSAFAATAGVATAAQISRIASQSYGGGSGGSTNATGGGGGGAATAAAQPAQQQQQPSQIANFELVGDVFGREQVIGLIGQINEAVGDGVELRST